jgi:2-hydroxychromene-2-carboxylate isomerase
MSDTPIAFYFDVVCPYAWVASRRLAWLSAVTGRPVVWRPILLGGVLNAVGNATPMADMPDVKRAYTLRDVTRQAARVGRVVRYPEGHPRRTVEAMRLLTVGRDALPHLAEDLWHAYWTDNADLTDRAVLQRIAEPHGVDVARIDDPAVKAELRTHTDAAVEAGVFGVPTLICGEHQVWGSDRLVSFAQQLGAEVEPALPSGPVEVFHDFSSPYSYLGVMTALNAGVDVTLRPMLLGALFQQIGTPIVPIATFSPAKQRWAARDMGEQARFRGLPFRFTDHFPLNTIAALRVALAEPATTATIYRAAWAENANIADPEVLSRVLDTAGFDGPTLLARTQDPAIKAELRANTDRAVQIGVPGAPTFVRPDGERFWGQDRLDAVAFAEQSGA